MEETSKTIMTNENNKDGDELHALLLAAAKQEGENHILVEAENDPIATTCSSSDDSMKSTAWMGRILLLGVAVLYGTLNVVVRWLYALDGPPTAPALSTTSGWLAVACFAPCLVGTATTMKTTTTAATGTTTTTTTTHTTTAALRGTTPTTPEEEEDVENAGSRTASTDEQIIMSSSYDSSSSRPSLTRIALELAIWNFGTQGLSNAGMITCPSARASFLGQCSVVMTPVLSRCCCGYTIHAQVWMSCLICLSGLILLSYHGKPDSEPENDDYEMGIMPSSSDNTNTTALAAAASPSTGFGWGDTLVLMSTLSWSIYLIRMSAIGQYGYNETLVQVQKNVFLAALYTVWWMVQTRWGDSGDDDDHHHAHTGAWMYNPVAWLLLCYSAAGPGTLADVLQQKGQVTVPATESNIILSMEPLFTTILSRILLGETTSWLEKGGGLLMMVAALVASYP